MTGTVENPVSHKYIVTKQAKPPLPCVIKLDGRCHKQPELSKFICIKYVFQGIVTGHAYEMLLFTCCSGPEDGVEHFSETSMHFYWSAQCHNSDASTLHSNLLIAFAMIL
jgi:hypothetical protein